MCDPVIAGGAMLAMSGIQAYPVPTGKVCLEGCRSERRYSHSSGK